MKKTEKKKKKKKKLKKLKKKKKKKKRSEWPNFSTIWILHANLGKNLSGRCNLVLNFWRTYKGTHSNHIRQKNDKKTQEIRKITKFL